MTALYRLGLPALIVLVSVAPVRGQERRVERDTILIERTVSPEGHTVILRRSGPDGQTRVLTGDSARAWMRERAPLRTRWFGDAPGGHGFVVLDSLRGDRMAFRLHVDSLMNGRMRLRLDTLLERRMSGELRLRRKLDGGVNTYRFDGPPGMAMDGPAMRFRMEEDGPRIRMRRMAPGMGSGTIIEREVRRGDGDSTVIIERRMAPGMGAMPGRPMLQRRLREAPVDGNVRIERDGEGRVRVYRFEGGDGEAMEAPGLRLEERRTGERVIRLNRDGQVVEGDATNVRVERDADGGIRIYIPPAKQDETPAPRRTAPRSRRN